MTMVICLNAVPPEKNGLISAAIGIVLTVGGIAGPLMSGKGSTLQLQDCSKLTECLGAICSSTTWRWIFYLNLPTGGLALVAFLIAWPKDKSKKNFTKAAFISVDYTGSLLLLAASILLIFAMQEGGTYAIPWNTAALGACLTLVPACFLTFIVWQSWLAAHPDFPIKVIFPVSVAIKRVQGGAIL